MCIFTLWKTQKQNNNTCMLHSQCKRMRKNITRPDFHMFLFLILWSRGSNISEYIEKAQKVNFDLNFHFRGWGGEAYEICLLAEKAAWSRKTEILVEFFRAPTYTVHGRWDRKRDVGFWGWELMCMEMTSVKSHFLYGYVVRSLYKTMILK